MEKMNMKQRWYDKDPTVSLAISLLKNSSEEVKHVCAEEIIKIAKEHEITLPSTLMSKINNTLKRWYDDDNSLSTAMEYLKQSPDTLRKEIAFELIELLQRAESI